MIKPAALRAHLTEALPELRRNPESLLVFVDSGSLIATAVPGLSFEYAYTLTLTVLEFSAHPDAIMVPLLSWIAHHQPDLLANPARRGQIAFDAEMLSNSAFDLVIKIPLTERVGVHPRTEGGYTAEHYPEPEAEPYLTATHWQLYLKDELIAEWGAAPLPDEVPAPPLSGDFVVVLANVPQPSGRTVQFARDAENVLWRYIDETAWRVLYPLSEVDGLPGENGAPVEMQVGSTHLQWRYVGEASWRNLIAISELQSGGLVLEEW